jgi:hypothetical protein
MTQCLPSHFPYSIGYYSHNLAQIQGEGTLISYLDGTIVKEFTNCHTLNLFIFF